MRRQAFSGFEHGNRKRKTGREEFLEIMDEFVPPDEWVGVIAPFYPDGKRGRPPKGIEKTPKKGREWRFGGKRRIGADAFSGLVHAMEATPANVHDTRVASKLIRDDDEVVYGDSGYPGIEKRKETVSDEHLFGKPQSKPRRGVVRGCCALFRGKRENSPQKGRPKRRVPGLQWQGFSFKNAEMPFLPGK